MKMLAVITRCACAALILGSAIDGPASARKPPPRPPMPQGYEDPGPPPADILPKIVGRLRTELRDPYSMRDLTVCTPERLDPYFGIQWVPARWSVRITLNAKNSFGGYTGSTMYTVTFERGEISQVTEFRGVPFVGPKVNADLLSAAQRCPRIPDAEIQRLLAL